MFKGDKNEFLFEVNKELFKFNHIYIYGSGEFSVELMFYLLHFDLEIDGFIKEKTNYYKDKILDKDVFDLLQVKFEQNDVILLPVIYSDVEYTYLQTAGIKNIYVSSLYKKVFIFNSECSGIMAPQVFQINNQFIKASKKFIYGAGKSGKQYLKILKDMGVKIDAFVDSDEKKSGNVIENTKVISKKQMYQYEDIAIVIPPAFTVDIYNNIDKEFQNSCYLPPSRAGVYIESESGIEEFADLRIIQKLFEKFGNKKIVCYGTKRQHIQMYKMIKHFSVEIAYIVDDKEINNFDYTVKQLEVLKEEKFENLLLIIPDKGEQTILEKKQKIIETIGNVDVLTMGNSDGRDCQYIDVDLGFSVMMSQMGFKEYHRICEGKE